MPLLGARLHLLRRQLQGEPPAVIATGALVCICVPSLQFRQQQCVGPPLCAEDMVQVICPSLEGSQAV